MEPELAGKPAIAIDADISPSFTLGIEEEYMVIDPLTFNLKSHIDVGLLEKSQLLLHEHVKPEMHGSMLEIGTNICSNIGQAKTELTKMRSIIWALCRQNGLLLGAASTHPFAEWEDQEIYPDERYQILIRDMQMLARSLVIFGMHIHIGIEDRNLQIQIMNEMRYFLPHILAISTNSPFWTGHVTGLKSYRDNAKKIWWDIRPHPVYPTLEIRICDIPMRIEETIAIAALCQAIVKKLYTLYTKNLSFRRYSRALILENKWRAVRYGLDGKLIDFGKQKEVPTRDLIRELLEFVDDVVDDLGSRKELEFIHEILEMGSGADRQIKVYEATNSFDEVVAYIHKQSTMGLHDDVGPYIKDIR